MEGYNGLLDRISHKLFDDDNFYLDAMWSAPQIPLLNLAVMLILNQYKNRNRQQDVVAYQVVVLIRIGRL